MIQQFGNEKLLIFMCYLVDRVGDDTNKLVSIDSILKKMAGSKNKKKSIVQRLLDDGLLTISADDKVSVTHRGIDEVESALMLDMYIV